MVLVMQTDAPFWDSLVFEGIHNVDLEAVTAAFGTVGWWPEAARPLAACPDCGPFSDRVHDRYQRRLTDPRRILGVVSGGRATVRRVDAVDLDYRAPTQSGCIPPHLAMSSAPSTPATAAPRTAWATSTPSRNTLARNSGTSCGYGFG